MSMFWLGTHMMSHPSRTAVPLCLSYGRLRGRKALPAVVGPVFLDSRGFSEIAQHGRYTFTAQEYAGFVARCRGEWGGRLAHASVMDWMCEPPMLEKTGLTVAGHQRRTVDSYLTLAAIRPDLPWVPVLQGWHPEDYHRCADLYLRAGVDLHPLPLVGVGSVCRRQGMREGAVIVKSLYARGFRNLHGFGFKVTGLVSKGLRLARYLASSDSMAWSTRGRKAWHADGRQLCGTGHRSPRTGEPNGCGNCLPWALQWRARLVAAVDRVTAAGTQTLMW